MFSLVICTYKRPGAICRLLDTVVSQERTPDEVIIIDGSPNRNTEDAVKGYYSSLPIRYFLVSESDRGLTKQRNIGIQQVNSQSEIICFLDDDIILYPSFFKLILKSFEDKQVIGASGYIVNGNIWKIKAENYKRKWSHFEMEGYYFTLPLRDKVRKLFGVYPTKFQPGTIPPYSHGKDSLPPTGKEYEVDHIMGGITAYRKRVFDHIKFSSFFEGYGLYEDFDFSVRASQFGKLIVNTAACLEHHHEPAGRPNMRKYGQMMIRNGWYVWHIKFPDPSLKDIFKWYLINLILIFSRFGNVISGKKKKEAWGDVCGRIQELFLSLIYKVQRK